MSVKQVVETFQAALAKGDMETVGASFADDVVWHQPGSSFVSGSYEGKEALFAHLGRFMELSGGTFKIDRVEYGAENGNLVASSVHFTAEAGGDKLSMSGVDLFRVEDGKIVEVWLFSEDSDAEDAFWNSLKK